MRLAVGCAAIAAGLIHAAVIGGHADDVTLSRLFMAAALIGVASGAAVLATSKRWIVVATVGVHLVFLTTWVLTRTVGISFVGGLAESEPVGFADAVAAALALVVVAGGTTMLLRPTTDRVSWVSMGLAPVVPLVVVAVTVPALVSGANHQHSHAEGDVHSHAQGEVTEAEPHEHAATDGEVADAEGSHEHSGAETAKPFDPSSAIDLSGTPGVTQVQQKEAEFLLARTLDALPAFADPAVAEAFGYRSIGDGFTGDEHFINWSTINDEFVLDPRHPEALVYNTRDGGRELEAAMFIMPDGYTLGTAPPVGGPLIQWHIHDDLCFSLGDAPQVSGLRSSNGACGPGLQAFTPSPMIHVWISPNPCGPFSALEGVGAGQVKAGETRACDHAHGSTGSTF
jgi:hypothetical protein